MPFRRQNYLHELITGTADEVAMAICFYSREETRNETRNWETQVLPELRATLGLPETATWQAIFKAYRASR